MSEMTPKQEAKCREAFEAFVARELGILALTGGKMSIYDAALSAFKAGAAWSAAQAHGVDGWLIPLSSMSQLARETFTQMMRVISKGGSVDVVARCDGRDYRWECDGLKYATPSVARAESNGHLQCGSSELDKILNGGIV